MSSSNSASPKKISSEPLCTPFAVAEFVIGDEHFCVCAVGKKLDAIVTSNGEAPIQRDKIVGQLRSRRGLFVVISVERHVEQLNDERNKQLPNLLTLRELQIVILVADGLGNKQIADRLHISEWTVSTHLRRIFTKLQVDSRAAMVYRCSTLLQREASNGLVFELEQQH